MLNSYPVESGRVWIITEAARSRGENPKVVQEILGHSQITHTMDTYSHVTPNMQRAAFSRLGERLR